MKSHLKLLSILAVIAYAFVGPSSASAQLQWVVVNSVPTSQNLRSITYGDSQYVAVGDNGAILTSPNGLTWTSQTSSASNNLLSVTYGNGQYVAVGTTQGANLSGSKAWLYWVPTFSSPNGITWTGYTAWSHLYPIEPPYNIGNGTVTYCNGQYVLVTGYNYSVEGLVLTSFDDSTWNVCADKLYLFLNSITFGNSQYVAVGTNNLNSATINTSSNCISWSVDTSGANNSNSLNSVTYENGHFVAVGVNGTVLMSSSGTTWTNQASGTSNNLNSVTYSGGQYVAVGDTGAILNSPDAINWAIDASGTNRNLNSVVYGNGAFVAVGDSGTILISATTAVKPVQTTPLLASSLTVQSRNSLLTISLPSAMLGKAVDLAVYSVSGREIMRKRVKSDAERFTVPVGFSYGSYILVANDGSRKTSVRFVTVR